MATRPVFSAHAITLSRSVPTLFGIEEAPVPNMLAAHRLSVRCWAGQLARSRCIPRSKAPAFRWQPLLASAEGHVGDSGSPDQEPVRKMITFLPFESAPLRMTDLSQCQLEAMLKHYGARGFVAANGKPSRTLAELPEGGTVRLSYRVRPCSLARSEKGMLPACRYPCCIVVRRDRLGSCRAPSSEAIDAQPPFGGPSCRLVLPAVGGHGRQLGSPQVRGEAAASLYAQHGRRGA